MAAFKDVDVALLVGARPRGPGMERKDLLAGERARSSRRRARRSNAVAKRNVKVLVVGNPANTNCLHRDEERAEPEAAASSPR